MAGPNYGLIDNSLVGKNRAMEGFGTANALQSQMLENRAAQIGIENAMAERAAGQAAEGDVSKYQQNLMNVGLGKQAVATGKAVAETEQAKMKALTERLPIQREMSKDMAFNPSNENIQAHLQDQILKGWITPDQAKTSWANVANMNPDQRREFFLNNATKAEDVLQQMETRRHNRVSEGISAGNLGVAQGHLALARQESALKNAPEAQVLKDIQSNTKALKTAGYNPETGEDKVSELIQKSTSGRGEALGAALVGAAGGATSGMKAIGQLDTISKTMTLDLLNNKLGAGISNADRDALEARFGSIADPNLPAEQRLAAWTEAKEIMRKAAMLPEVKKETKPAATKSGASVSNW